MSDEQHPEKTSILAKFLFASIVLVLFSKAIYRIAGQGHKPVNQPKETVLTAVQQSAEAIQTTNTESSTAATAKTKDFTPSANDMGNLARAMGGGAAGQQLKDAPKDKYDRSYIIGDLGGVPVNLLGSVVRFVEYDDSPGWDPEALRNYKPSVRSYQSIIESFGFTFHNHDAVLYDRYNSELHQQYEHRGRTFKPEGDWVRVGIESGKRYSRPGGLDRIASRYLDHPYKYAACNYWVKLPEKQFGLDVYIQPEKKS